MGGDRRDRTDAKFDGTNIEALTPAERDRIDLANESAGNRTGRNSRFLTNDQSGLHDIEAKKKDKALNALMRLLLDPAYARLYRETERFFNDADEAARRALLKLEREAEGLHSGDERYKQIETARREIEDYRRDVIGRAKERFADPDNPYSASELEELRKEAADAMPETLRREMQAAAPGADGPIPKWAADEIAGPTELNVPELPKEFSAAAKTREPYGSQATPLPATSPKNN